MKGFSTLYRTTFLFRLLNRFLINFPLMDLLVHYFFKDSTENSNYAENLTDQI